MQGVIKAYDPATGDGSCCRDTDLADYELAADALDGSVFRMLRQGQRVVFDLDDAGLATRLRLGSEVDMGTPGVLSRVRRPMRDLRPSAVFRRRGRCALRWRLTDRCVVSHDPDRSTQPPAHAPQRTQRGVTS